MKLCMTIDVASLVYFLTTKISHAYANANVLQPDFRSTLISCSAPNVSVLISRTTE